MKIFIQVNAYRYLQAIEFISWSAHFSEGVKGLQR